MEILFTLIGSIGGIAGVVSVYFAWQTKRKARDAEHDRNVREVSALANKVVAATIRVDDLGNQLKMAYRTLFTFAGQGVGSSRLKLYTDEIEEKQTAIGPMQDAARGVLENDPTSLSYEKIQNLLLQFDGHAAQLERVREKFIADLASVEAQNQMFRQENMKIIGPGA